MPSFNSAIAGVASVAIVSTIFLGFKVSDQQDTIRFGITPPAPSDWLTQAVDLTTIERIEPRSESSVVVYADGGKPFTMELTTPCPGVVEATSIGFFTDGFKSLDRFAGILVNGRACSFKDFRPGL